MLGSRNAHMKTFLVTLLGLIFFGEPTLAAPRAAAGLVIYSSVANYPEIYEFSSITQKNRFDSVVACPDGRSLSCKTESILAVVNYPQGNALPENEEEVQNNIQNIAALQQQYPKFKTQLQLAESKWKNALEIGRQLKRNAPAFSKPSPSPEAVSTTDRSTTPVVPEQLSQEVQLTRDTNLFFKESAYRMAKKGEILTVLQYRADTKKYYVLSSDPNGKSIALNVDADAVILVPKDADELALNGISAFQHGKFPDAIRLLRSASSVDAQAGRFSKMSSSIESIVKALNDLGQASSEYASKKADLDQKRRFLKTESLPNALDQNSYRKENAISRLQDLDAAENAFKKNISEKEKLLKDCLAAMDEIANQEISSGAYSTALNIKHGLQNIANASLSAKDSSSDSFDSGLTAIAEKASIANKHLFVAREQIRQKQIVKASATILAGLEAEPGNHALQKVLKQTYAILLDANRNLAKALSLSENKDFEGASALLQRIQEQVIDRPEVFSLEKRVTKIIAEKELKLRQAQTDEEAGNFESALTIYETYKSNDAVARVLPKLAKMEETNGNFTKASELYTRAGLASDVQRIVTQKAKQDEKYKTASILLALGKFDEAIAIFDEYKDNGSRISALIAKGSTLEDQQEFDKAMSAYQVAGALEQISKLKAFRENRIKWAEDGTNQEKAGNYDAALELFTKGKLQKDIQRVAKTMAKDFEAKKDFESAAGYYELAGEFESAGDIRKKHDIAKETVKRHLSPQEIFVRCSPACVTIETSKGLGSGFFVGKNGYLLTNRHVIADADDVAIITSTGKRYPAKVIESSKIPDIALLKAEINTHPVLTLGDSSKAETGQTVYAIGSPKGLQQSFTGGMISNTDRTDSFGNPSFQISVLINHGNSGGPLIDETGSVVGINTSGEGTFGFYQGKGIGTDVQGINYAIRINEARELLVKHSVQRH